MPTFDLLTAAAVLGLFPSSCPPVFHPPLLSAQPHSHSSSLSSVELFSASDDIHRFSAQVPYSSRQRAPVPTLARSPRGKRGEACADSKRMSTNQFVQCFKRVSGPSSANRRLYIADPIALFGVETLLNVKEMSGMASNSFVAC